MKINVLGGSYSSKYPALNSQRTINWYPVISGDQESNKNPIALLPTPGLTLYTTLPGRYARGFFTFRSHLYTKLFAVVDTTLYEVTTNGTYNTIGTLSNLAQGNDRIIMECNLQNELFIGGYNASYVYDVDTAALTQVTDSGFPGVVDSVTYLDQYMVICSAGAVFESLTTSALNWTGGQNFSPTFKSAPVIAVGALKEQLFNFTTETIEIYINDGTSPYSRLPRSSMLTGIIAKDSLATWSEGFFFLGKNRNGEAAVFFFDGYNPPQPISDTSITWQLNQGSPLQDAYGYVQETKDGHIWYYLTIPSLPYTFVYDMTTHVWHYRQSQHPAGDSDGSPVQSCFRGAFQTTFNGKNYFLDRYSGKVFVEDFTTQYEDSLPIRRERTSQIINEEDKFRSIRKLVIDCNVGQQPLTMSSTPVLQVSWSDNGGYLFNSPTEVDLGATGDYQHRVVLNNLGMARQKILRLVLTDPVDLMIQGAYVEVSGGNY